MRSARAFAARTMSSSAMSSRAITIGGQLVTRSPPSENRTSSSMSPTRCSPTRRAASTSSTSSCSLCLELKIDMHATRIKHDEFCTLIKDGTSLDLNQVAAKTSKWITDLTWLNLVELSKLLNFVAIRLRATRSSGATGTTRRRPRTRPCRTPTPHLKANISKRIETN